jgi:hypothetical protein
MTKVALINLEDETWSAEVGPAINDPAPTSYHFVQTPAGICLLMNSDVPYGGWLAKQVSPLVFPATVIDFYYTLMIDDATPYIAQIIETDAKITDKDGWTYDLSAQWNLNKDWLFQVDNNDWTWRDTNVQIDALEPLAPTQIVIHFALDYAARTSAILGVTVEGDYFPIDHYEISARQEGWAPNEIVTQLQQCNNAQPGGYELRFNDVGYVLELPAE